jgi:hypothetical protein
VLIGLVRFFRPRSTCGSDAKPKDTQRRAGGGFRVAKGRVDNEFVTSTHTAPALATCKYVCKVFHINARAREYDMLRRRRPVHAL